MFNACRNLGFGLGFRFQHFNEIIEDGTRAEWFEALTENFIGRENSGAGLNLKKLERLREKFPIVFHGVSLSIGSSDPLNKNYLARVKTLYERIQPEWVSDHFCWTSVGGHNSHDLLPLPLTEECLKHVIERIKRVQDYLGRRILLENASTYAEFECSTIPEWEFVAEVCKRADCGILLDVNNIYVSSFNHGFDPYEYLKAVPKERVGQIHLAGHKNKKTHLIDTHDHPVCDEVWDLYAAAVKQLGPMSTMIERDDRIPPLQELEAELDQARALAKFERPAA